MHELESVKEATRIDPPTVRLTQILVPTNVAKIINVVAVATVQVGGDLFRMEYSVGALWEISDTFDTGRRFEGVRDVLEDRCQNMGLDLCEGMFEET